MDLDTLRIQAEELDTTARQLRIEADRLTSRADRLREFVADAENRGKATQALVSLLETAEAVASGDIDESEDALAILGRDAKAARNKMLGALGHRLARGS